MNIDISKLNILRLGLKLGEFKGKDFIYDFHLSRYLSHYKNEIEISDEDMISYRKGLTLNIESNKGFILVKNKNVPLSFGKSDGHIIKNHYPKHLRR
jgi:NOL1/NOP2/fmu family ribosome biogenesis protein